MSPSPRALIEHKRDGHEHAPEEIHALIRLFGKGELADYQMSAWLMAAFLRGLSDSEMRALTEAMLQSGKILKWPKRGGPVVDKHSTGGVGDKLSIPLAPLVAACGLRVPMIAGRGLGHTGGTLDKLEAIGGYQTRLDARRFARIVAEVGAAIIGQTKEIAPADGRIYALRDVTGTVAYRPLIVASILSKKLAAGLDGLVLDVKVGRGAFMKDLESARALAKSLVDVASALGTPTVALLTDMDAPLGRTIGNALEVRESVDILRGQGPADSTELTLKLGEEMLLLGGLAAKRAEARKMLDAALASGAALERLRLLIEAQGGDGRVVDDPRRLPAAPLRLNVTAPKAGFVHGVDPLALAEVALEAGAGRKTAEDKIDPAVGVELTAPVGARVEEGQPLALLHLRKKDPRLLELTRGAFTLGKKQPAARELSLGRVARRARV